MSLPPRAAEGREVGVGRVHQRRDLAHAGGVALPACSCARRRSGRGRRSTGSRRRRRTRRCRCRACGGNAGAAGAESTRPSSRRWARTAARSSPLGPRPGYPRSAVGQLDIEARSGACSVCTARTCASLRQLVARPRRCSAAASRRSGWRQPTGSLTMPSATPSAASQAASTASCTSFTCAGRIQAVAHRCAKPSRRPACCRPVQWITGTRLKMPSKSFGIALRHRQALRARLRCCPRSTALSGARP